VSEHQPEARPGFDPEVHVGWAAGEHQPEAQAVRPPVAAALDRESLGRIVHETRLACEAERAALEGRKRFNLEPWERRTYEQQETDMRMAEAVARAVLGSDEAAQ
jgi:hypothetical protein